MSAPKILTAICITCDKGFKFEYRGGPKSTTCSDECKKIRAKKGKRIKRKEAKVGESEFPINYLKPNVSDTDTYKAISAKELETYISQSATIWENNRLRGTSPDVDTEGWERRMAESLPEEEWVSSGRVTDLNGFMMDDHFDVQSNPLALISQDKRLEVDHWLKKHRFKAGWDVGQTVRGYLPVLGSDKPISREITSEQYRRHFGQPSTRPTGALTPFVWHMDEPAPKVVEIHAWGIPMKIAS